MAAAYSTEDKAKVRDLLTKLVKTHFSSTLGKEKDVVNCVMAQIYVESRFVNKPGITVGYNKGTTGYSYMVSSAVSSKLQSATPIERSNIEDGLRALGVMQVMGWNLVRGGSPSGKCEVERLRPDLAGNLCVSAGEDVLAHVTGAGNLEKALLLGLVVLEGKYKATYKTAQGFQVRGDKYNRVFQSRLGGAFGAYLGLGKSDQNGMTPERYAQGIMGGDYYQKANYGTTHIGQAYHQRVTGYASASTNGSDLSTVTNPGC